MIIDDHFSIEYSGKSQIFLLIRNFLAKMSLEEKKSEECSCFYNSVSPIYGWANPQSSLIPSHAQYTSILVPVHCRRGGFKKQMFREEPHIINIYITISGPLKHREHKLTGFTGRMLKFQIVI